MSDIFDPAAVLEETMWLLDHPDFDQKPASIMEFLGPGYLDIESKVRTGLKKALVDIFGEKVNGKRIANFEEAMVTGGIGIGKTTFASIALPYMCHWVLCLRDPQAYFDLLPGSRIAFMQMSTSETQAREVIFGDIVARVKHSDWFVNNYPMDSKIKKQIRFPKDVWILPGDSSETTFEGYNILAGILDEMDSHMVTKDKDYADVGFDTINSRIASRFIDTETNGHKGLLICIGQMKKGTGFASRKYEEMMNNPKAYVMRMTIWDSLGWDRFLKPDGTRDSFYYDTKRKMVVPKLAAEMVDNAELIEVPTSYSRQFENNPEKALRDLAGIPPKTSDPFISLLDKIDRCRDAWTDRYDLGEGVGPIGDNPTRVEYADWFRAMDSRRRAVHIDLAQGGDDGDAAGIAMGHIAEVVEVEGGEKKPVIVIDCMIRLKALPGSEIMLSDIRRIVYYLKEELGFRITKVTMDGFQSTDTMQQLRKRKYSVEYLSVDRSTLPYEDLREAIYEERLEFPPYQTFLKKGDDRKVEIAIQELQQLQDTGKKIDHPAGGSKDVSDTLAGVCSTLMGDRRYRRGVTSIGNTSSEEDINQHSDNRRSPGSGMSLEDAMAGLKAPIPPSSTGGFGISIPSRLRS